MYLGKMNHATRQFCNNTLPQINHSINNRTILQKDSNNVWTLNANIKVNPHANLTINNKDASWIKITNNKKTNQPNSISILGGVKIDGVKITSWNPISNDVIQQNKNGTIPRAYINIMK